MKTLLAVLLTCALSLPALAANDEKEEDRVKESGVVLKEILNIPDDIPRICSTKLNAWLFCPRSKKARSESAAATAAGS